MSDYEIGKLSLRERNTEQTVQDEEKFVITSPTPEATPEIVVIFYP